MKAVQLSKAEKLEGNKYVLHRMVNPLTMGSKNLMSFLARIEPQGEIPEHKHGPAEVALHFLEGKGLVTIDGEEMVIERDTSILVPVGSGIGLKNSGANNLIFLAVLSPPIDVSVCPVCGIEAKPLVATNKSSVT